MLDLGTGAITFSHLQLPGLVLEAAQRCFQDT